MIQIGQHIIHFDQLHSTNVYATELLSKEQPAEGTVVSTSDQYAGIGQRSNAWESEPYKNISLSVILYPNFLKVQDQFRLNQVIALAIFYTLDAYLPQKITIKWPNDIYIGDKKVAGVLVQNQVQGQKIASTIIGIGINVNQERFLSDAPNPVSLYNELEHYLDLDEFRKILFENLTQQYRALQLGAHIELNASYLKHLYRFGELCKYEIADQQIVSGTIVGINAYGNLQVHIDGATFEFGFKEIRYL